MQKGIMILSRSFFQKPTLWVAKNLLGKVIVRKWRGKTIKAIITETEAYIGSEDLACHASRGRTPRSEVLFWRAGHAYVYLIYGMHYCFNVVTEKEEFPSAVLIRGILINGEKVNGPGRVCRALHIDQKLHGKDLIGNKELWFADLKVSKFSANGGSPPKADEPRAHASGGKGYKVQTGPRVGVDYAGKWAKKPWRFWLETDKI